MGNSIAAVSLWLSNTLYHWLVAIGMLLKEIKWKDPLIFPNKEIKQGSFVSLFSVSNPYVYEIIWVHPFFFFFFFFFFGILFLLQDHSLHIKMLINYCSDMSINIVLGCSSLFFRCSSGFRMCYFLWVSANYRVGIVFLLPNRIQCCQSRCVSYHYICYLSFLFILSSFLARVRR